MNENNAAPSTPGLPALRGDPGLLLAQILPLMQASEQGYGLFDDTDTLHYGNAMFRRAQGLSDDAFPTWADLMRQAYRQRVGTQIDTDDFDAWLRSAQSRRGKLPFRTIETQLYDGRWLLITETTLAGGWMLCVFTDISTLGTEGRHLRQERDEAMKSAFSDVLTGLSNRRYLMARLADMLSDATEGTLGVVILDLDRFKQVNDTHGHDHGDRVLCHFGALLQSVAGRDDLVGRLGGEEFLLVCRGATASSVRRTLDTLLDTVRHSRPFNDLPAFQYTCSAGAAMNRRYESAGDALRRADQALYRAKREGRDRTVLAEDDLR